MNKKILIFLGIILLLALAIVLYSVLGTSPTGNVPLTNEILFEQVRNSISQHLAG